MIPIPSLLVLEFDPTSGEDAASDGNLEEICFNENAMNGNETATNSASNVATTENNDKTRKRTNPKRQRRWVGRTTPLTPAPMRLRRIQKESPPRYQGGGVHRPRAPFWERQKREEEQKQSKHTVATIKRRSQLFAFLVTLVSFAVVDDYMLLPSGTLLYAIALSIAWENWTDEAEENLRYLEKIRRYRNKLRTIESEVQKAEFEYHVLRNQPHVEIVALRRNQQKRNSPAENFKQDSELVDFDPDNDHWIIYADEKKHRPHRLEQPKGPPKYRRSNSKTSN